MARRLRIIPLTLPQANSLVERFHRHHKPARGHKFSLGVEGPNGLVGAAICGRPVARWCPQEAWLEISRLVTDGTKNACSKLYAACARIAKEAGYEKIQTYVLDTESGVSLRAAGWTLAGYTAGGDWNWTKRTGRRTDQPMCPKQRWVKELNEPTQSRAPTPLPTKTIALRWCSRCEQLLPKRKFYAKSPRWCRACRSEYQKDRRADPNIRAVHVEQQRLYRAQKRTAIITARVG